MIRAILRAQLLSLRAFGRRRRAGSILSFLPALAFFTLWLFAAFAAYVFCANLGNSAQQAQYLAIGFLGISLYWQLAPVITVTMGASLELQKLIVYPIPLDRLFGIEILLRLFTVGEMLVVLTGAFIGMLSNSVLGGWAALPRLLAGLLLFILFNLIVAAGIRSLIERVFKRKRVREIAMLVFVIAVVLPGALAAFKISGLGVLPYLPLQEFFPWSAAARAWLNVSTLSDFMILAVWIALAYRAARRQFFKSLREDPNAGAASQTKRRRSTVLPWLDALYRLPGRVLPDPLAAMIEKEIRALSRSAGFRLAFLMGFTFGLLVFLPNLARNSERSSFLRDHYLAWVSIYSVLLLGYYTFFNSFGYDRSAVQFYFAAPVSFRTVLVAKNAVALIVQFLEVVLVSTVCLFFPAPLSFFSVSEAFCVTAVVCLYLLGIGNITSVRSPNPMDPDKMSRGGSSRGKSALTMLLAPVAFLPVSLAYWGDYVFHSHAVFFLILLLAGIIGGIFYWVATDSALELTPGRREEMIEALSRGAGPLSISG